MWQEGVASIVMVTNIKEDGKTKCQQYWPESGDQKYGPFTVSITEQTAFADYVIRVFEVTVSGTWYSVYAAFSDVVCFENAFKIIVVCNFIFVASFINTYGMYEVFLS